MTRQTAFDMLRRTHDELEAGRFALSRVLADLKNNPNLFIAAQTVGVTATELKSCALNLEITFVLRLFAEFEAVLRDYWKQGLGRVTNPDMGRLMNSIAAKRNMNRLHLSFAHEIREY